MTTYSVCSTKLPQLLVSGVNITESKLDYSILSATQNLAMQPVEKQIKILANKVDDVYQILDRLHHHLVVESGDDDLRVQQSTEQRQIGESQHRDDFTQHFPTVNVQESADWLVHQDVLVDGNGFEPSSYRAEPNLSPQSQIQRLTAQLTVAYSRIAALEDQLLSKRFQ